MKCFLKWVAIVAGSWVLLIVLFVGFSSLWWHWCLHNEWNKARSEIRAQGEKILTTGIKAPDGKDSEYYDNLMITFHLDPSKRDRAREELVKHQLDLSPGLSSYIMNDWSNVAGQDFLPLVRKMVSAPYYDPNALRALAQIKPDEARPLIIEDIQRDKPLYANDRASSSLEYASLLCLPQTPIPELEPFFRQQLTTNKHHDLDLIIPAIEHYGTSTLLPDLINFYSPHEGKWPCLPQTAALRFWIHNNPQAGLAAVSRALNSREKTHCYCDVLSEVLVREWTPDALPLVTQALNDPDPRVVASSVAVLMAHADSKYLPDTITALQRAASSLDRKSFEFSSIRFVADRLLKGQGNWTPNDLQRKQLEALAKR